MRAAGQAEVTYSGGRLRIRTPKPGVFGRVGTVDITVGLPAGSQVEATGGGPRSAEKGASARSA